MNFWITCILWKEDGYFAEDRKELVKWFEKIGVKLRRAGINTLNGALQDYYGNKYKFRFRNKQLERMENSLRKIQWIKENYCRMEQLIHIEIKLIGYQKKLTENRLGGKNGNFTKYYSEVSILPQKKIFVLSTYK